jgi:hypothetical protein
MPWADSATTGRRRLRRSIREFGESLGPTPDAVAAKLRAWGVRGIPKDSKRCAIACCLQAMIGIEEAVTGISVTDRSVHVSSAHGLPMLIKLPKPVSVFIKAFDTGCYPELLLDQAYEPEAQQSTAPEALGGRTGKRPSRPN